MAFDYRKKTKTNCCTSAELLNDINSMYERTTSNQFVIQIQTIEAFLLLFSDHVLKYLL